MSLLQYLAGRSCVRRAADGVFARFACRRVVALDQCPVEAVQRATLLRLVRRARYTRFGRDHGFAGIRTVADYQARVPLRDYEAFWRDYWQPAFPYLDDVSWPGPIPYLALSSGTTSGTTKYLPISPAMLASNRRAALSTLALFLAAYPGTPLFTGRIFFLGGSTDLRDLSAETGERRRAPVLAGDLSGIAAREVSSALRPYTFPPLDLGLLKDWDEKVQLLAQRSAALPITVLGGVPSWLLVLFERLRQVTGKERIADIWPTLRLIMHGGTKFDPYRTLFRQAVGSDAVRTVETYPASEGFVAAEDPRHGLLRLIPDHNLFFEFVPVAELSADRPTRHTVADVVPGVQYAVVLTTCAGLWSYVLGDTVCFERREPPLLRFTGRTRYFLSAFGEHLISEEIERAVAAAAEATGALVIDFHVGPEFPTVYVSRGRQQSHEGLSSDPAKRKPDNPVVGRHRYLIEFAQEPRDLAHFTTELDQALCRLNEDYQAHRQGDLTLRAPQICPVRCGGFADWLRSRGQLGGQHKVPRLDNSGQLTEELLRWFAAH
jgi:hypothetical protein